MKIAFLAALGFLHACISNANADLITNGSFETFATSGPGISSGGTFVTYQAGTSGLSGWSILDTSIDIKTNYWQQAPGGGSAGLDLMGTDGANPGSSTPQYGGNFPERFRIDTRTDISAHIHALG